MRKSALFVWLGVTGICVLFAAVTLVGDLYLAVAGHGVEMAPESLRTLTATRAAIRLLPWSAEAQALEASAWGSHDAYARARAAQLRALSLAPGDWLNWQTLYESGMEEGDSVSSIYAQRRLEQLAPNSDEMNLRSALLGLRYWDRGDKAAHVFWRHAMKRSLMRKPVTLLYLTYVIDEATRLCMVVPPGDGNDQARYRAWCKLVPQAKQICVPSMPLNKKERDICRALGAKL